MPRLVKPTKFIKALSALGFLRVRQKGFHVFFEHPDGRTTIVPLHAEIKPKLLTKIIRQDLKMEKDDFFKLL